MSHPTKEHGVLLLTKEDEILQEEEDLKRNQVTKAKERGLFLKGLLSLTMTIYYDPGILNPGLDLKPQLPEPLQLLNQ